MIFLSSKHGILTKRSEYKINRQYQISDVHKRYLMCLASERAITVNELKKFVYGKRDYIVSDHVIRDNIEQIKSQYHINIKSYGTSFKLCDEIKVGD